jgi:hypothetical protein
MNRRKINRFIVGKQINWNENCCLNTLSICVVINFFPPYFFILFLCEFLGWEKKTFIWVVRGKQTPTQTDGEMLLWGGKFSFGEQNNKQSMRKEQFNYFCISLYLNTTAAIASTRQRRHCEKLNGYVWDRERTFAVVVVIANNINNDKISTSFKLNYFPLTLSHCH